MRPPAMLYTRFVAIAACLAIVLIACVYTPTLKPDLVDMRTREQWHAHYNSTWPKTVVKSRMNKPVSLTKNIWTAWFQGVDKNTPKIVQRCIESWRISNPAWRLTIITYENLHEYLDDSDLFPAWSKRKTQMKSAAQADVVRAALLRKHGGVWADATTFNTVPLDTWLPYVIGDLGYFAFRNLGFRPSQKKTSPSPMSSWFLYGEPSSRIIQLHWEAIVEYWTTHEKAHQYFWYHELLCRVFQKNQALGNEWVKTAVLSSDEPHVMQFDFNWQHKTCSESLMLGAVNKLTYKDKQPFYNSMFKSMTDNQCKLACEVIDCANNQTPVTFEDVKNVYADQNMRLLK